MTRAVTIKDVAREAGVSIATVSNVLNGRTDSMSEETLQLFLSVSEMIDEDWVPELQRLRIPAVLVNRAKRYPGLDQIDWDDVGGVGEAMDHLVSLGHRRIAHLCGPRRRRSGARRLKGYKTALRRHGIPYRDAYVCPGDYTADPATWRRSTRALLQVAPPPTAIVASDDTVAAMAMKTLQQAGLRVPQDVAVIGIDDQHFCTYLNPALTTVRLPVLEAGRRAVEVVLGRITGQRDAPEHITLPCSLVVRESCGAPLVQGGENDPG
jgi:DNA-binding LacI/PurR family transcriptional regulator